MSAAGPSRGLAVTTGGVLGAAGLARQVWVPLLGSPGGFGSPASGGPESSSAKGPACASPPSALEEGGSSSLVQS